MNASAALFELIRSRRSIRQFQNQGVSRELIEQLLEAARWAPSNHNRQPWRFIVVQSRPVIVRLAQTVRLALAEKLKSLPGSAASYSGELQHHATLFEHAPVVVLALHKRPISVSTLLLADVPNAPLVSGEPLSVAMAVQNLLLAAHALGLGTCVMTAPLLVPGAIAEVLPLPAGHDLTCVVALGYPKENPDPPRRKNCGLISEYINDNT